ncbi:MAG: XisI protein [Cyanobacteria bacterium J06648_16]
MDRLAEYRTQVQALLRRYASEDTGSNDVEVQLLFDTERDHYQWMNIGWEGFNRIYRSIVHFDIKDGKVWLQQNLTDENPAEDLVAAGLPREDIILGLQPPYKRQYTGYGSAVDAHESAIQLDVAS